MEGVPAVESLAAEAPLVQRPLVLIVALLTLGGLAAPVLALDLVKFRRDDRDYALAGQLLVTAADGGLLLKTPDGELWAVTPDELVERNSNDAPFEPLAAEELGPRVLATLPDGFTVHATAHYLICYDTSRAYAQWCGSLFERLYLAFLNYWKNKGFEVAPPEFPLVAVVFADRRSYERFSQPEVGDAIGQIIGFYSLRSNRVTTFDLTGIEAYRVPGARNTSATGINRMLERPDAERAVATIVHEATHQLAFNCGLQTRYTDVPYWVSEGIAVYFETPDLKSRKGWRNIGAVNLRRLEAFRRYLLERPPGSLASLVANDDRFRDPRQAENAYAEAWALNYFLLKQEAEAYHEYLRKLSAKGLLIWDEPATRLAEFQAAFGDLEQLDAEFVRYFSKLR